MLAKRLIKSNDAGGGCTNTVDLYNPFPDGGGVALYQLNGDADDVSGNYDGTASNVTYGTGQFGQAGVFNGSNSQISYSNQVVTNGETSVSFWYNPSSTTQVNYLIGNGINTADKGITIGYNGGTNQFFGIVAKGTSSLAGVVVSNATYSNNGWYNIVFVWDGTTSTNAMKLYVNNFLDGENTSDTSSGSIGSYSSFNIGGVSGSYSQGSIDQVRIFRRALRPYEVEALYTEEYCTPTIVPSEHFNTVTYTGSGSDGLAVTGTGFSPDFVWIKPRTQADNHNIYDTLRGVRQQIIPNNTSAESTQPRTLQSFDADGFTLNDDNNVNNSGIDYVAWNFKAGGSAVSNTDGTITSQVSANTEAGFSVVSWTPTAPNQSVGHGLGQKPSFVITKSRNSVIDWYCITDIIDGSFDWLLLNSTSAKIDSPNDNLMTNTFETGYGSGTNLIAYCFAEVEGFSNFGSYVGNGSTSGPTVVTGFEPAFVMIKNASAIYEWVIVDNKRSIDNPRNKELNPNSSAAENGTGDPTSINFLENGFQIVSTDGATNQNNGKFIYMAFAADPITIEPSLEDSFNTVLWTGDYSATRQITGVGFQPDLVWTKGRNNASWGHFLQDSIRGAENFLISQSTAAEGTTVPHIVDSFDADGFTIKDNGNSNATGDTYVAWNWKGAELPAINSNGSITSVVSANPAAGFSIVSYNGNSIIGSTVGHGLNSTPDVVIYKGRGSGLPQYFSNWGVYHSALGATKKLWLNDSYQATTSGGGDWINSTEPTDSVFTVGEYYTNWTGRSFIAYCFAEVAGFSKFDSYSGTGSNGNFITTGFEPAFLMVKRSDSADNWVIVDNKRGTSNSLFPDDSSQELSNSGAATFSSTGFTVNGASGGWNNASGTYIYMAFANQF